MHLLLITNNNALVASSFLKRVLVPRFRCFSSSRYSMIRSQCPGNTCSCDREFLKAFVTSLDSLNPLRTVDAAFFIDQRSKRYIVDQKVKIRPSHQICAFLLHCSQFDVFLQRKAQTFPLLWSGLVASFRSCTSVVTLCALLPGQLGVASLGPSM